MAMQKKACMTTYIFKQWLVFSCKSILGGVFQINQHLLIMGEHHLHVTIQTLEQTT
jgi:hypothetical protein